jgi:hypothetical protein
VQRNTTRRQEIFSAVLLLLFAGVLFLFALHFGGVAAERLFSARWVPVSGTVQRSGILACGKSGVSSVPVVHYSYNVPLPSGETTLQGDRIIFGIPPCGAASEAQAILAGYPPGASIVVFVNPSDVRESVLMKQVHWRTMLALVASATTGILVMLYAYGLIRRSQSDADRKGSDLGRDAV